MIFPDYIRHGDRIRVVSPAGKVHKDKILAGLEVLQDEGYDVFPGDYIFDRHFQYAGTDSQRIADFQKAINDPETKVILCARGGYGAIRIIEALDFTPLLKNPKWIVGFSDITVIHTVLNKLGIASIHGAMPGFFLENKKITRSFSSLMELLSTGKSAIEAPSHILNRAGTCTGELVGGNLSLLYSLQGTPWQLDTKGKILLLEDVNEYLYNLDRMMQSLRLGGTIKQLSGLVVGGFTELMDNESPFGKSYYEIIMDAVRDYHYPVCFDLPVGHIPRNLALLLGSNYQLEVGDRCRLIRQIP